MKDLGITVELICTGTSLEARQRGTEILFSDLIPIGTNIAWNIVRDQSTAESIAVETFDSLMRNLEKFLHDAKGLRGYYGVSVTRNAYHYLKQQKRFSLSRFLFAREGEEAIFDPVDPGGGPEEQFFGGMPNEALHAALGKLPETQRVVLRLRYFENLTEEAVAEILGCSPNTVKSRSRLGLKKLRRWMQPPPDGDK